MSVDRLQAKVRKMKCPIVLEFQLDESIVPSDILAEDKSFLKAYARYAMELMDALRDIVPAVRFHFAEFAIWGTEGTAALSLLLDYAKKQGYYILLNAPEALSALHAENAARILLEDESPWQFDGLVLTQFIGTDAIRPYATLHKSVNKSLFAVVRTANKSGPEMQDLITGGRLVHIAQADLIHRIAEPNLGRSGFCTIGVMAAATNTTSLQNLRDKFKYMFILIDGFDVSNANAKNCAAAFDMLGHGAAICVGNTITGAWKYAEAEEPFTASAVQAVEKIKKNLSRYVAVL